MRRIVLTMVLLVLVSVSVTAFSLPAPLPTPGGDSGNFGNEGVPDEPNEEFDYNGDGLVNAVEVLQLNAQFGNQTSTVLVDFMASVESRIGLIETDDDYIARFDINLNGEINSADFDKINEAVYETG